MIDDHHPVIVAERTCESDRPVGGRGHRHSARGRHRQSARSHAAVIYRREAFGDRRRSWKLVGEGETRHAGFRTEWVGRSRLIFRKLLSDPADRLAARSLSAKALDVL